MSYLADLHMHSTASDGTDSPAELLNNVRARGLRYFSLTDHDTTAGSDELARLASPEDGFIRGAELSCATRLRKCHILAYDYDARAKPLRDSLDNLAEIRIGKMHMRLIILERDFGIILSEAAKHQLEQTHSVGKPHIARAIVEAGYCADIREAFSEYLSKIKLKNTYLPAQEGVESILASNGIPVWAHPLGGEDETHLTPEEFFPQLELLLSYGLRGLECYYSRYTAEESAFLASVAKKHGLYISGGSDYHGENKNIPLGTLNADGARVTADRLTLIDAIAARHGA
ncbi:MAG: PHP domain-containing protein [Clostridia bacterium]|nr:PHP domain-containing protein [Clostridia bacterium]